MSDDQVPEHAAPAENAGFASDSAGFADNAQTSSTHVPMLGDTIQARLSQKLSGVAESADPVAALDAAVQTVADELSVHSSADETSVASSIAGNEVEGAIEALVDVALQADDPVAALEQGADSLAEVLAARDVAAREAIRSAQEQHIDDQAAYRHARFHRVGELIDLGYSLDQAVAVTNANEAEIRARAAAAGRDPMQPIYEYAVRNGYRGVRPTPPVQATERRSLHSGRGAPKRGQGSSVLAALAEMSDEVFAEATKGDRWRRLLGGQ